MNTPDINTRALLVTLTTSVFNPTRLDRAVTAEVTTSKHASKDAGNFKRQIIPKELLDPVMKAANAAYLTHKRLTSPWADGGTRLLCIDMFDKYVDETNGCIRIFEKKVEEFLRGYEAIRSNAPTRMGLLFDPRDYPPLEVVRERFAIRSEWLPLPNGSDFRLHLSDSDLNELAASVDQRVAEAVEGARTDLYERLHDRLAKVSERMSNPDHVFRDTLIENLRDLCKLIPDMCLTPDPTLMKAVDDAVNGIVCYEPEELRNDPAKRADAKAKADSILRTMGGFLQSNAA